MTRKIPRPFLMRGKPRVTEERPTIHEPPDWRVPEVKRTAPIPANVLRMLARERALDPRFRPVDRYLWRWSVGQGTGLPPDDEAADMLPESRPTALAPDEAIVVDMAIIHSAPWARDFLFMWFRSPLSIEEIGERLKIRARGVYEVRREAMAYYLGLLHGIGISIPTWEPEE
ncbi:MAG TPA: hypothetical protein VFX20_18230 [Steroidobacteraceae bacterium]|nr:hypothetical protein [Steroidobacteraceae bacterium]